MIQPLSLIYVAATLLGSVIAQPPDDRFGPHNPWSPEHYISVHVNSGCVYSWDWRSGPRKLCNGNSRHFQHLKKDGKVTIFGCVENTPDGKGSIAKCKVYAAVPLHYDDVYYGEDNNLWTKGWPAHKIASFEWLSHPQPLPEKIYK